MPESYALYLDDVRHPPHTGENWVLCRTVAGMRELLESRGLPRLVSFDYELSRTDPGHSGEDAVASFLEFVESTGDPHAPAELEVRLHTSSGYGAAKMAALLGGRSRSCELRGVHLAFVV